MSDRYSAFWLKRMPILDWLPRYNARRDLKHDFIAGFTVGVMLVPQEMSLAAMMGVPGEYGLYTAAIAPLIYPIFGSSKALSVANAAEGSLLVGVLLRSTDIQTMSERIATGILLTFLSGVLMVVGGLMHQGGLVSFFSRTSMNGYVTATAFLIVLSQIPSWLGITLASPDLTIFTAIEVISKIPETNRYSFILGVFSLVVLCICKKVRTLLQHVADARRATTSKVSSDSHGDANEVDEAVVELQLHDSFDVHATSLGGGGPSAKRTERATSAPRNAAVADRALLMQARQTGASVQQQPTGFFATRLMHRPRALFFATLLCDAGALLVCVIGILVGASLGEDNLHLTGAVHKGLPAPVFPPAALGSLIPLDRLQSLITNSVVIAIVLFMASVAAGSKIASKDGYEISPNQELLGLGFANLGASFFQGMPSSAGMSRSAVNSQSAHTPLASMITAVLVIFTTLFLTGPLYYLPQAPLAAIILLSALSLIDFSEPRWLRHVRQHEFYVWVGSFAGTLCFGLLYGLGISLVASLVEIMARTKKPEVFVLGQRADGTFGKMEAASDLDDAADDSGHLQPRHEASDAPKALPDALIVHMEQDLYFGNARHLIHAIERDLKAAKDHGRVLGAIIDGSRMNDIDATAIHLLREYQQKLSARDQTLLFANLRRETETSVLHSGLAFVSDSVEDEDHHDDDASAALKHHHRPSDGLASAVAFLRQ